MNDLNIMVEEVYDIPKKQNIPLKELEERGILNVNTARKLIYTKELRAIKIGDKWFVPRAWLIEFLEKQIRKSKELIQTEEQQ